MTLQIVQVNVSLTLAPTASTLQRTGAMISQGGTTETANTLTLLTQLADLTSILAGSKTISTLTWATNTVTVTTAAPHGWTNGDIIPITVAGAAPAGYNGTFTGTVTGASTLTYPLASNPGTMTTPGTITLEDVAELLAMATTFFAQGASQTVYVLELGEGTVAEGVTSLTTWLTNNPKTVYSFLVPREWDANAGFVSLITSYNGTGKQTYFFVTTTTSNYTNYTATMKDAFCLVEAPGVATANTEFSCAAPWWVTLSYAPNSTNKVPPLAYAYLFGVTPYPLAGNQTILTTLNNASVNFVGTGAQGGLSNTILFSGHLMSGVPFNFWYATDWSAINLELDLANAVINGSNSTLNPLYYDQFGINRLQGVAVSTMKTGVTSGLLLGTVIPTTLSAADFINNFNTGKYAGQLPVNAEPFSVYTAENPNDYAAGKYAGLSAIATPLRGFESVIFNLNVTDFAS